MLRGSVAPFVNVVLLTWNAAALVAGAPPLCAAADSESENSTSINEPSRIFIDISF
jgi:hypothetical protein